MQRKAAVRRNRVHCHRIKRHGEARWRIRDVGHHHIGCARRAEVRHANVVIQRFVKAHGIIGCRVRFLLGNRQIESRRVDRVIEIEEVVARLRIGPAIRIARGGGHSRLVDVLNREGREIIPAKREQRHDIHSHLTCLSPDERAKATFHGARADIGGAGTAGLRGRGVANDQITRWINDIGDHDVLSWVGAIVAHADDIGGLNTNARRVRRHRLRIDRHIGDTNGRILRGIGVVVCIQLIRIGRENRREIGKRSAFKGTFNAKHDGLRRAAGQIAHRPGGKAIVRVVTERTGGRAFLRDAGRETIAVDEVRQCVCNANRTSGVTACSV